jgi:hypothetical protein
MSELDVIVIHIRAEQAAEYERLFAESELPRWRDFKARGAFLSARISRVAFGTDNRQDVVKYVIAVEVPPDHRLAAIYSEHRCRATAWRFTGGRPAVPWARPAFRRGRGRSGQAVGNAAAVPVRRNLRTANRASRGVASGPSRHTRTGVVR